MAPDEERIDPRVLRTHRDVIAAARDLLVEEGWTGVTHAAVAERAGYTRSTIYSHWPTGHDLVSAAVAGSYQVGHITPVGDLRADLVAELQAFVDALEHDHLDRVVATLAERAFDDPELGELLHSFFTDGSSVLRQILDDHPETAPDAELLVSALGGTILSRVLLERRPVDRRMIERLVDRALRPPPPA